MQQIAPDKLLAAYRMGAFPMAQSAQADRVQWYRPHRRGIIPLTCFHLPGTLARRIRRRPFRVSSDEAFEAVLDGCADRATTWINDAIRRAYLHLHRLGVAHSVECWQGERLVGGLYGVAVGSIFCGESMFHAERDASKVALVHLVRQLRRGGFTCLDTQYYNDHLAQFGCHEISAAEYDRRLSSALRTHVTWWPPVAHHERTSSSSR